VPIAEDAAPDKGEEPAHIADFLAIDDTFKVVEMAVENTPKKEALKGNSKCAVTVHFGPGLPGRFARNTAALETTAQKGNPKATSRMTMNSNWKLWHASMALVHLGIFQWHTVAAGISLGNSNAPENCALTGPL
jgi:hypothetical protein